MPGFNRRKYQKGGIIKCTLFPAGAFVVLGWFTEVLVKFRSFHSVIILLSFNFTILILLFDGKKPNNYSWPWQQSDIAWAVTYMLG